MNRLQHSLRQRAADRRNQARLRRLAGAVQAHAPPPDKGQQPPVVFFRASTGLLRLSQNAAFALLSSWALRLNGVPVAHFACRAGMSRCVQGLNREDYSIDPPCRACTAQAQRTYAQAPVHWFDYQPDPDLQARLPGLDLEALSQLKHDGLPLGQLVLPSLRWALRRHHLPDNEPTRFLFRQFLLSAARVAAEFEAFLERVNPQAVVVFNGMFFPEAAARQVALARGLRVITHEVGMRPFSAFFTAGQATAYPIDLPDDFQLDDAQNARLDAYLSRRFQGDFTMAGIRFWPEMRRLDPGFLARASRFRQIVPVFTNVVYDTSQVHANSLFPHMFAWLDAVAGIIQAHPETLFVVRGHPDEHRLHKESRETVAAWVRQRGVDQMPNTVFIDGDEYLSSYELIQRAKFAMVYNSSIGLEAALLGAAVVCGGRSRYSPYPITYLPETRADFQARVESFLEADEVQTPVEYQANARRFLYYQLYHASLPFDAFLEPHGRPGFVQLRDFPWRELLLAQSPTLKTVVEGIVEGKPFLWGRN